MNQIAQRLEIPTPSEVQAGLTGLPVVSGVCGSRGLSCSLILLTEAARA